MKNLPDLSVKIRVGGPLSSMICRPTTPYSPGAISFLSALSRSLLKRRDIRQYPDVASFAYWCRSAHLSRLARDFDSRHKRIGRGLVLHIAPGNVPVNFAFTLAFGMLSGNANIVRIPEVGHPEIEVLSEAMELLFGDPEHASIAVMNRVVQYARDDGITSTLSAYSSARVLWGGDQTIAHLRTLKTSPRCIDIAFADRYSLALIDSQSILNENDEGINKLVMGFFNDAYLQDQNACSSPHLIIWLGRQEQTEQAKERFWLALESLLRRKYRISPIHAVNKFIHLCRTADLLPEAQDSTRYSNNIYRVRLKDLPADIEHHRGYAGFFYEYTTQDLDCLKTIVGARYQTLSCFGLNRHELAQRIIDLGLTGIDRIVPVGQALDIGVIWDGYDLINTLSRIIHCP
jgi:hypothetical protein